jgi:drug/metabolite transporter (DMT)-like permease
MIGLLGVGFIVYPDHAGSQGSAWGIAMVVWAALYLMAAETRHRRSRVADQATIDAAREPIRA